MNLKPVAVFVSALLLGGPSQANSGDAAAEVDSDPYGLVAAIEESIERNDPQPLVDWVENISEQVHGYVCLAGLPVTELENLEIGDPLEITTTAQDFTVAVATSSVITTSNNQSTESIRVLQIRAHIHYLGFCGVTDEGYGHIDSSLRINVDDWAKWAAQ